jgi:Ca2+-binding RTX toxin-like protein
MIELDLNQRNTQPYSDIGLIKTTWSDGSSTLGTCSLVGRNDILTAGHCVFNPDEGGWATGFEFYFGVDYNATTGSFDSWVPNLSFSKWSANAWTSQIYTDANNKTMLQSEAQFDVALIGIDTPIGDQLGWLGLAPSYNGSQSAIAVGYPTGSTGMMMESVAVYSNWAYGIYESFIEVMGPGSSGGPLLMDNNIIGVKSTGIWWADLGNDFIYDTLITKLSENNSLISDSLAPTIYSISPLDGATAVAIASNINLTFSEAIQKGIGTIAIHAGSAGGAVVESFDAAISPRLVFSGSSLTIDPLADLGNNTQYFVAFAAGSVKDMAGNNYAGNTTYDFTTIKNTITGTADNDNLVGTNGDDIVNALAGNDTIKGGLGADQMVGGLGNDTYTIDNKDDLVIESKIAGTDTVNSSISYILSDNVENLILNGKSSLNGTGNSLNNNLTGNAGANSLKGLTGNDLLFGGLGKDKLTGGLGKDTFDFYTSLEIGKGASRDSITDFSHSQHDRIDLSGIDANSKKAGNQAFTYIDSKAFDGKAGEIHFIKGILSGDTNGDKVVDFEMSITLVGGTTLVSQDFIL